MTRPPDRGRRTSSDEREETKESERGGEEEEEEERSTTKKSDEDSYRLAPAVPAAQRVHASDLRCCEGASKPVGGPRLRTAPRWVPC